MISLGIDTGGTYTDGVLWHKQKGLLAKSKSPTTRENLSIGIGKTVDEIGDEIGADKLFYQTLEDLVEVTSINGEQSWDTSCFNGEYVTGNVTQDYLDALEAARNDSAKSSSSISDDIVGLHNDE